MKCMKHMWTMIITEEKLLWCYVIQHSNTHLPSFRMGESPQRFPWGCESTFECWSLHALKLGDYATTGGQKKEKKLT